MKVLFAQLFMTTTGLAVSTTSNDEGLAHNSVVRKLQTSTDPYPLDVDTTCATYENAGGFDCDCTRDGALGVKLQCQLTGATCTDDNGLCISNTAETVLDPVYGDNLQEFATVSLYYNTCSEWTQKQFDEETEEEIDPLIFEACVKVTPESSGAYTGPISVSASWNILLMKRKKVLNANVLIEFACLNLSNPVYSIFG
jgi:hypothetical protein